MEIMRGMFERRKKIGFVVVVSAMTVQGGEGEGSVTRWKGGGEEGSIESQTQGI